MSSPEDQEQQEKHGFVEGLKTEWNLFWESIIGDEDSEKAADGSNEEANTPKVNDPFLTGKLEKLTLEQIKAITKALSSDRKTLNQKLESISKEIEENNSKLETMKLVGGETDETLRQLHELSDLGQELSEKLNKINDRLKVARQTEDHLKKSKINL